MSLAVDGVLIYFVATGPDSWEREVIRFHRFGEPGYKLFPRVSIGDCNLENSLLGADISARYNLLVGFRERSGTWDL